MLVCRQHSHNLPAVSDDVVEKVLSRLLWLADDSKVAQRLSYRALDVEQIGSVYEGIMGFTVEQAQAQRGDHLPAATPEDHDHRGGGQQRSRKPPQAGAWLDEQVA